MGYGSGGQNRTHDYTGRYKRLDSFYYGKCVPLMKEAKRDYIESSISWTDGGNIGIVIYPDKLITGYYSGSESEREEVRDTFLFDAVPNNYGGTERIYFLCPYCGRRSRYLYLHQRHFKCRICARLNYRSQQATKGTDASAYKMRKLLRDKFKVSEDLAPIDAVCYIPERPKGMHMSTYNRLLLKLDRAQDDYHKSFVWEAARICGLL